MKHLLLFFIFNLFWNLFPLVSFAQFTHIDTNEVQILIDSCKSIQENEEELSCHNSTLTYIQQAIKSVKEKKVKIFLEKSEINTLRNIGNIYRDKLDLPNAKKYYQISLKKAEIIKFKKGIAAANFNLGNVYLDLKDYKNSLDYFQKCLKIFESIGDEKGIGLCLNGIGSSYNDLLAFGKALEYFPKSLKIFETIKDTNGITTCLYNIANAYEKLNDYANALNYYQKGFQLSQKTNNNEGVVNSLQGIGDVLVKTRKENEAAPYFNKAFDLSKESDYLNGEALALSALRNIYENKGKYKEALKMNDQLIIILDSINGLQNKQEIIKMEMNDDFDKKEAIAKAEHEKQIAIADAEAKKQRVIILSVVGGLLLVVIFAGFIFRSLRITRKQNHIIELQKIKVVEANNELHQQNNEILAQRNEISIQRDLVTEQKKQIEEIHKNLTDSVNYAKRIQEAVLPVSLAQRSALGEHFVLFKPKDIVSGDFFWTIKINNVLIVAVADCTGHGVPGAFMSMLGVSFLNEIVRKKEVTKASEVLNHLRESIIEALQQKGTSGEQKDGMDIAFCALDTSNNLLQFAGANNSLYLVRNCTDQNGENQMEEIKADIMPVAIYENMHPFTNWEIWLKKGDCIYIKSDGYQDQFGGPNHRKFLSKNLRELIKSISHLPMNEQKNKLELTFENWKGEHEQIDDVTILGLRI